MRQVEYKNLKQSVKKLIDRTTVNSISHNRQHRCKKYDDKVFVASIEVDGRTSEWIEVVK